MNMENIIEKKANIKELDDGQYVMLKSGDIIIVEDYINMLENNEVRPADVYAVINVIFTPRKSDLHPVLMFPDDILDIALSITQKFRFELFNMYYVFPMNPEYLVYVVHYKEYVTIEILNVNSILITTNADKIVNEFMSQFKGEGMIELSLEDHQELRRKFLTQKIIANHDFIEVREILHKYYNEGDKSLESEVDKIVTEYYKVFKPLKFYI